MFDRRKEHIPVQIGKERRIPVLTENRIQLIWEIACQNYIDKLQKTGIRSDGTSAQ